MSMLFLALDESGLETYVTILAVVCAIALIVAIALAVYIIRGNKGKLKTKEDKGERVQTASEYLEEMEMRGEFYVLARNVIYSAGAQGQISTGKYIVESSIESEEKFNVRFNGLVREFSKDDSIYLAEGDTISGVSNSILIKKV